MKNVKDVWLTFQYKQWWTFRAKHTLWETLSRPNTSKDKTLSVRNEILEIHLIGIK